MGYIKWIAPEKQAKRGWTLYVNGVEMTGVLHVRLHNPQFGEVEYGETEGGWDSWAFNENGGGGVVTLPFANIQGRLYVGLVYQNRPLQGGKVFNTPRGFVDPGEENFKAAVRELQEEMGWVSPDKRMKMLAGSLANPNSAFFNTAGEGMGVKYYAMEILPSQLEPDQDGLWKFREGIVCPVSKIAELIYGCKFMPWRQATELGDQFTLTAIARLLAAQLVGF